MLHLQVLAILVLLFLMSPNFTSTLSFDSGSSTDHHEDSSTMKSSQQQQQYLKSTVEDNNNNSEWLHRFLAPYFDLFQSPAAPSQDQKQTQAENSVIKEPAPPPPLAPVEESVILASSRTGITDSCPTASSISPCVCSASSATTLFIDCSNQTLTDVATQLSNIPPTTPVDSMNFAFNKLTTVPDTRTYTGLKYLNLSSNAITEIPATGLPAPATLVSLDLSNNQLATFVYSHFTGFNSFTYFNMSHNLINSVTTGDTFFAVGLKTLTTDAFLDLSYNRITAVAELLRNGCTGSDSAGSLCALSGSGKAYLNLSYNPLTSPIKLNAFVAYSQSSSSVMNFSHSQLTGIKYRSEQFVSSSYAGSGTMTLDLSYNSLTQLDAPLFNYHVALQSSQTYYTILDNNQINAITNGPLQLPFKTTAWYMSLKNNSFASIDGNQFACASTGLTPRTIDIISFDLSENAITEVTNGPWTMSFPSSKYLLINLSSNAFTTIQGGESWFKMSTLKGGELIFSNNKIGSITNGKLPRITSLSSPPTGKNPVDLSRNALTTIDAAWFDLPPGIKIDIDVSFNAITSISNPPFTMSCDSDLNLNLAFNQFTSISGDAFNITCSGSTAIMLNISGNPITSFPTAQYSLTATQIIFGASHLGLTSVPANLITSLSNFASKSTGSLTLDLSYNALTAINAGELVMSGTIFEKLSLNNNNITSIAPGSLPTCEQTGACLSASQF